ncbi:HK97 gp10 family phage protein [Bacillus sp. FJAT-49736]|uniref:HK97 gp10 family phage protein n=1 Tax=Bacillus sp. FJAT-49736 TaxID=2833582 RepID=UPI001BC915A1|nr:HK97 gp10 family phage protein [Bacillus sp. FJAT-49736]MBS4172120.1 HK97 gp10 family phage protein [Bacillus sp. FJAT-49736]
MASGGFEFEEVVRLAKRFQKAIDERIVERFIRGFLLEMAYRAEAKMKRRTPVNTGDLRRKWTVGNIERQGSSYVVEIFNNLDYASFVEYGFRSHFVPGKWEGKQFRYIQGYNPPSGEPGGMYVGPKNGWVEGKFMMTISMKEIERELPRYLEQKQAQLINEIMNGRPTGGGNNT